MGAKESLAQAAKRIGYYAPNDPLPGSESGRWLAEKLNESWLRGASTSIWWCACFASMCTYLGGGTIPGGPFYNCQIMINRARNAGQFVAAKDMVPGDLVMYDWQGAHAGNADHVGIFEYWIDRSSGIFSAIEGNTSSGSAGSQSAGNGVWRRSRNTSVVPGAVRPAWNGKPAATAGASAGVNATPSGNSGFSAAYVRDIQTRLGNLGYSVGSSGADGSLGPATRAAVKSFQKAKGLVVDGLPGPATLAALKAAASKSLGDARYHTGAVTGTDKQLALKTTGELNASTIGRWQQVMGTPIDFKLDRDSTCVRAFQRFLNKNVSAKDIRVITGKNALDVDGVRGPNTTGVWQYWSANRFPGHLKNIKGFTLSAKTWGQWVDKSWGPDTTRMLQAALNDSYANSGKIGGK